MTNKRSGKWYRKNEAEIMLQLGLEPTKNSGSGWIEKEDGMNEQVICQLKSTDASSIKVNLKDLQTLEYNASVAHKIPVFAINFISNGSTYLLVSPESIEEVVNYLKTGVVTSSAKDELGILDASDTNNVSKKSVRGSKSARDKFHKEANKKYNKVKGDS